MIGRPRLWLVTSTIFTLINVGGAAYAGVMGEAGHFALHVVLIPVGAYFMWRSLAGKRNERVSPAGEVDGRLESLQQSLDSIAVEVERIGEGQRFTTKIMTEKTRVGGG